MKKINFDLENMWEVIDTVLLDMDGTLLDKHFDDYFWERYVPEQYAVQKRISVDEAKNKLLALYKSREGTLEWTDLDFWSDQLELDIPGLKMQVDHLIQVHPYVVDFLKFCRLRQKKIYLVTNAHDKTLDIKLNKTAIGPYFDKFICSKDIGKAKEEAAFWDRLANKLQLDKQKTLLADDTEAVLQTAEQFGIKYLIFVAKPSSKSPVSYSESFPSILYFKELIAGGWSKQLSYGR